MKIPRTIIAMTGMTTEAVSPITNNELTVIPPLSVSFILQASSRLKQHFAISPGYSWISNHHQDTPKISKNSVASCQRIAGELHPTRQYIGFQQAHFQKHRKPTIVEYWLDVHFHLLRMGELLSFRLHC